MLSALSTVLLSQQAEIWIITPFASYPVFVHQKPLCLKLEMFL